MPRRLPGLDLRRPLGDETFSGQFPATVVIAVALTSSLVDSAQVDVEQAALLLISPDVAVDGLVADREEAAAGEVAADLLGAPLSAQQFVDERENLRRCRMTLVITSGVTKAPVRGTR